MNNSTDLNSSLSSPYKVMDRSMVYFSYFVVVGIIIVLGFICNTISMLVFIKSKALRQSTTGLYLMALAVADLLFLIGEMLRWLDTYDYIPGYNFLVYSNASCQFVYSLRYAAKLTSAWITVSITAERFFIVAFPLKASSVCTCRKAGVVIIVTYAVCFTVGGLASLTIHTMNYKGRMMCGYHGLYMAYSWVVLRVGSLLFPGLVIFVLTLVICFKLARARNARQRKLSEVQPQARSAMRKTMGNGIESQLTAMLLSVAIAFVVLRIPYTIMFYVNDRKYDIIDPSDLKAEYCIFVTYKVTDLLAALNYAVNFFLYCLSGSIFRKQFFTLIRCISDKNKAQMYSTHGHGSLSIPAHHLVSKTSPKAGSRNILSGGLSRSDNGKLDKIPAVML